MIDPLLLDVPDNFETARLLVRAPRAGDGPAVNAAIVESMDRLRAWMPWADHVPTVAESESKMREMSSRWTLRSDLPLLLFHKETGDVVGGSGLHRIDWSVPRFEIGYWSRTKYARQGYVVEAVVGVARLALDRLGARRVEIHCDARNVASRAVAVRAGFPLEAILRNHARALDGAVRDTCIFALTDGDRRAESRLVP
jgi:RimJ/RimL family protein N-acetyltransferase